MVSKKVVVVLLVLSILVSLISLTISLTGTNGAINNVGVLHDNSPKSGGGQVQLVIENNGGVIENGSG